MRKSQQQKSFEHKNIILSQLFSPQVNAPTKIDPGGNNKKDKKELQKL